MIDEVAIRLRFEAVAPFLDERGRRLAAASEALAAGRGGIAAVSRATGIAASTIGRGLKELAEGKDHLAGRQRRAGGGTKNLTNKDALYNFLSTFSGTHFVTPRAYQVHVGVRF